jgi:hypothetical protein
VFAAVWDRFCTGIFASCYNYSRKDRTNNVKMADKRRIDIKVTEKEFEILDRYCNEMGLSKTVVLRELIRKLGEETAAKAAQSLQGG